MKKLNIYRVEQIMCMFGILTLIYFNNWLRQRSHISQISVGDHLSLWSRLLSKDDCGMLKSSQSPSQSGIRWHQILQILRSSVQEFNRLINGRKNITTKLNIVISCCHNIEHNTLVQSICLKQPRPLPIWPISNQRKLQIPTAIFCHLNFAFCPCVFD